jgi:hypothetical protein
MNPQQSLRIEVNAGRAAARADGQAAPLRSPRRRIAGAPACRGRPIGPLNATIQAATLYRAVLRLSTASRTTFSPPSV